MRYSGLITRPTEGVKLLPVIEIIAANIGVVVVEELTLQGTMKQQVIEEFKPLVTNDTIASSEKYKSARQVRNTSNFAILTNHLNALPIASDDRRFHVLKTSTETRADLPCVLKAMFTPSQLANCTGCGDGLLSSASVRRRPPEGL